MALRKSVPLSWAPMGLTDSYDDAVFPGAMLTLQNLVPDVGTKGVWRCRPASLKVTSFSGYTTPGFISCLFAVGSLLVGMVSSGRNSGKDEPFVYNTITGLFATISGITSATCPNSPSSSGAWVPPTATLVGGTVIITHPGFNHGAGIDFGVLNISNPAAPTWTAQTLTGAVTLPTLPTAVAQFNGRCYYAVLNAVVFSDTTSPTNCTSGAQVLTFGTNQPITALIGLPLTSSLTGGITQSLIVFIGTTTMYQITGDAATSNFASNNLNVATGTYSQNSVCPTPQGLAFISPDGLRFVDLFAHVSDPVGAYGAGITQVFANVAVPSRLVMQYTADTIRVSLQNGLISGTSFQEYFYHLSGKRWSGPHTFPASLIQPVGSTFYVAPVGILGSIWSTTVIPSSTSTFIENGTALQWSFASPLLPESKDMCMHAVIEQTVNMAINGVDTYTFSFQDEQQRPLQVASVTGVGASTTWGAFTWGNALWSGSGLLYSSLQLQYAAPVVFKRAYFIGGGPASASFRLGAIDTRVQKLGYLIGPVAGVTVNMNRQIITGTLNISMAGGATSYTLSNAQINANSVLMLEPLSQRAANVRPQLWQLTPTTGAIQLNYVNDGTSNVYTYAYELTI